MHWVRFCFSSKVATLCRFWSRDSIDLRSFHPRAQLRQQRREKKSEDPDSSSSVYTMGHLWQQGGILSHFWTVAQCLKICQNVAFNIASEASYVYVDKSSSKMPKMASFWKPSWKIQMRHFWCFSNQCAIFLSFFCNSSCRPFKYFCTEMIMMDWAWKSLKVDVKCSLLDLPGAIQALHPFTSQVENFLCQIQ